MNNWLLQTIVMVFSVITPELRNRLIEFINQLEADAKKTPNPWDDIFIGVVRSILDIKDKD